jgi:4-amino-4-deoxy-L-arabinose transferase-like glycosyltransferase
MLKLNRHEYIPIMPWVWLITLALLTSLFYQHEKTAGVNLSLNITRLDLLWMIIMFLSSLVIGGFTLQDIPNIMIPDESAFWEYGRAIAIGNDKPIFFDFGVYSFPVASSIFQGWVIRLFGVNLWGWRFASVLAGSFTVFPLYLLAREWFDRRIAVMATLFMISSPYYLSFARLGYNNSQSLFPTVLSLYFWSLGFKRTSNLYYTLAGLAAGLGFYTYIAAWLGLITVLKLMVLVPLIQRSNFRQAILAMVIFFIAVTFTAAPRLVYGASSENTELTYYKLVEASFINSFYGNDNFFPDELHPDVATHLLGTLEVFYAPRVYAELLTRGIIRTIAALFDPFILTDHFITTNLAGGFLFAIALLLGLSLSLRNIKQTRSILLLTWFLAGLFFLSCIAAFPPRSDHLVTIIPVMALFSAVGPAAVIDTFTSELRKKRECSPTSVAWLQKGLLVGISAVMLFSGLREYFIIMPTHNLPRFEDIASWIAWRTEEPLSIVYVGSAKDEPHNVEHTINTHLAPHRYTSVTPNTFRWENFSDGSIIFLEGRDQNLPAPPSSFTHSATYLGQEGEIIGYAWTNTDIELQPAAPIPTALSEILVKIMAMLVMSK